MGTIEALAGVRAGGAWGRASEMRGARLEIGPSVAMTASFMESTGERSRSGATGDHYRVRESSIGLRYNAVTHPAGMTAFGAGVSLIEGRVTMGEVIATGATYGVWVELRQALHWKALQFGAATRFTLAGEMEAVAFDDGIRSRATAVSLYVFTGLRF